MRNQWISMLQAIPQEWRDRIVRERVISLGLESLRWDGTHWEFRAFSGNMWCDAKGSLPARTLAPLFAEMNWTPPEWAWTVVEEQKYRNDAWAGAEINQIRKYSREGLVVFQHAANGLVTVDGWKNLGVLRSSTGPWMIAEKERLNLIPDFTAKLEEIVSDSRVFFEETSPLAFPEAIMPALKPLAENHRMKG